MNNQTKMLLSSIGICVLLCGLAGCGGKKEEEPPIDAAKESQFVAPKMGTSGSPGGAPTSQGTAKPVTQ